MITRARAVATGLAAILLLVLLVIGLPVVLLRFGGSPFPARAAGWHALSAALSRAETGTLLLAIVRDCSWAAWLLFTACVSAEAQAAIRGRGSPRLRLGGLQGGAAHLVALAALAFVTPSAITLSASVTAAPGQSLSSQPLPGRPLPGLLAVTGTAASPEADATYLTAPPADRDISGGGPASAANADARVLDFESAQAQSSRIVTVRPGDCLWLIAQRYLGAGDRYPEIAQLNYGRDMGRGQIFTNPSLIEPGWRLFLPGSGSVTSASGPGQSAGSDHLGHATADPRFQRRHPPAREDAAAGHHSQAGNEAATDPAPARTAARGGEPASRESAEPRSAESPATGHGESAGADVPAAGDAGHRTPVGQTPGSAGPAGNVLPDTAIFMSGVLAGAVLTSLARLRRRQRQQRRRGRRIALPADPDVLAAEQHLRAAASSEPVTSLRDALACLEAGLRASDYPPPDIVGLHVTPDALEVLLAAPAAEAPPLPYTITPGRQGMCWQLALPAATAEPGVPADGNGLISDDGTGPDSGSVAGRGTVPDGGILPAGSSVRPDSTVWPGSSVSPGRTAGLDCHLLPGLITAGTTGDGYLLLDLESLQVTACDGPAELVDDVIATVATELATGQWSGWYDLILVGCDELEVLGRAEHCATVADALVILEARHAVVAPRLAERAPEDARELRLAEPDNEDWGLTLLVSRTELSPVELQRLLELAEDGAGLGAMIAGDGEAADGQMAPAVLQLAPDTEPAGGIVANVVPFQITVRPRTLSSGDYDAIATLFAAADDLEDVSPEAEPYAVYGAPPWIPQASGLEPGFTDVGCWEEAGSAPDQEDGDDSLLHRAEAGVPSRMASSEHLRIRILGPFVITGAAAALQPKQAELVLALALAAPAGLSNSALCSILGADPDHPKPGDTVRQIITRTRRRLGLATDGQEYIIHVGNGQYLLHSDATLDWTEFRSLVATGRADELRAAVSLIGGQPFTGGYFWWIDIPLIETVRAELVDAAEALAEFELASGAPRAAARAARAGLLAESSAEQLWRAVMRAEHAAGNLAGVTEAWRRCLDAIEDIAPGGEPHPHTAALYRQLTMTAQQHVPVGPRAAGAVSLRNG